MSRKVQPFVLSAAFALTGVATALLGASLPAMLQEWHLTDAKGGWLLFSSFAGSTVGSILVYRSFRLVAALGLALSSAASLVLSFSSRAPLIPGFIFYGLGLGTTMTAISLLRSRSVPPGQSNVELNRLNLVWALGACFAPALALRSLHRVSVSTLFEYEALALGAACAAVFLSTQRAMEVAAAHQGPAQRFEQFAPVRMCLFAGSAVGLETAIGSWLTTYAQRMGHGTTIAVSANSAFWVGLLLSRAAHSLRPTDWLHTRRGVAAHLLMVSTAVGLLIVAPVEVLLPIASLLAGLGLGPLYPLVLSLALPRYRSGAVFALAGIGAAVLPWATGSLSTRFHSLRAGLLAPCATVFLLLLCTAWLWREIPVREGVST